MAKESIKMDKTGCLQKRIASIVVVVVSLVTSQESRADAPSSKTLLLDNPYWNAKLDTGGYSDVFWWEQFSPRHNYTRHEMLSGEWGAAIYYDGIGTGSKAMWLTDKFLYPDWDTYCDFTIEADPAAWDDPNPPATGNPVVGNDTGTSTIENPEVSVRIDYEMVDLGEQGPGSPMAFGSLVGADAFVYSDRYVLLQTYTITNRTQSPIENLEFYQMLHGHPANEGNAVVYSVYDDTAHDDPLENYVPYNDVHREEGSTHAGNFRYDITQWNNSDDPDRSQTHRDWIGFSSTVPPDFIENGYYEGHDAGKPPRDPDPDLTGTHWNIEDRNLNGKTYSFGEAAGAMGWNLGTLAPDDSVKLTLAIMFGAGPIQKTCQPFEPIAYWSLDEGSGAIAHDSIGDNDGTLVGDPEPEWVAGYHDGALEFGGTGYVALSDPVGALTGDSVTVSAWVKPGNMGTVEIYDIFSQTKRLTSSVFGYSLYLETGEAGACRPGFRLKYPGWYSSYAFSDDEIARSEWAWVVGTNDGTTLRVYVNGVLKATDDSTGRMGVYADAYIGYAPGDDPFIGVIDDVWVLACAWDGEAGCLPYCDKGYFDWVLFGRPDCWCSPRQCHGDTDDMTEGNPKTGYFYVHYDDLNVLLAAWNVNEPPMGPGIATVTGPEPKLTPGICADFAHDQEGGPKTGYFRVHYNDLSILVASWSIAEPPQGPGITGDCLLCDGGGESRSSSSATSELSKTDILDWLAEIWLDPEARERIDAEAWLKLYESIQGYKDVSSNGEVETPVAF